MKQTIPIDEISLLERYRRLIEISRDLASTLDLNSLLNRIVHAAADLSGAEAASILLFDPVKQELYFDAATNLEEPLMRGLKVPLEGSIAGWIVTHKQPIIIQDTQNDPRHFGNIAKATHVTTTSMLAVPLVAKEKVIGVLEAINKLQGEFDQDDQDVMMTLGAQAAVAIENARLFQQSDLISELVHELRTPLTSLNTAARLLVRDNASESMRSNMADLIFGETTRLSELTTSFLDLARLESGRMQFQAQVVDLKPVLDECVGLMQGRADEKGIRIELEMASDLPEVRGDRDKLKQVILNLMSNAIKYNITGGSITVTAGVPAGKDELVLTFSDTGPGIPPESLAHLFERFYRVPGAERNVSGTGLGLAICKKILDAHRGRIEVKSVLGKGTSFLVYLPLKAVEK